MFDFKHIHFLPQLIPKILLDKDTMKINQRNKSIVWKVDE